MRKAFLSHASEDKGVVGSVYKKLGAARVHYDIATFERGERSSAQIQEALEHTSLYVFFASRLSIAKPFVIAELQSAHHGLMSGKIESPLTFILDDLPKEELPEWLSEYVYCRENNASVIAAKIRDKLSQLELRSSEGSRDLFIGRDRELPVLKRRLADLDQGTPKAFFFQGKTGLEDGPWRAELFAIQSMDSLAISLKYF